MMEGERWLLVQWRMVIGEENLEGNNSVQDWVGDYMDMRCLYRLHIEMTVAFGQISIALNDDYLDRGLGPDGVFSKSNARCRRV